MCVLPSCTSWGSHLEIGSVQKWSRSGAALTTSCCHTWPTNHKSAPAVNHVVSLYFASKNWYKLLIMIHWWKIPKVAEIIFANNVLHMHSFILVHFPSAKMDEAGSWPILQPATRGAIKRIQLQFGKLCCPGADPCKGEARGPGGQGATGPSWNLIVPWSASFLSVVFFLIVVTH